MYVLIMIINCTNDACTLHNLTILEAMHLERMAVALALTSEAGQRSQMGK